MSLTKNLRVWRENRNITKPNTQVYVANVIEELLEIFHKDKDTIKYLQASIMAHYFADKLEVSPQHTVDVLQDIQVFSVNETELMGYDNEYCNLEVFKEINSRKQDPKQKAEWAKSGAKGKWLKDTNQPKDELYKADYNECRR